MGARETVMSDTAIQKAIDDEFNKETTSLLAHDEDFQFKRAIALAQTEVTWKARDVEIEAAKVQGFEAGLEQGESLAKKVVEWIELNHHYPQTKGGYYFATSIWQAQLKIWFKDNPELLKKWGL